MNFSLLVSVLISNYQQVRWENRLYSPCFAHFYVSVDGTDCPTREPSPFSLQCYSQKFRKAGLRYEIAVSIRGDIVWLNAPFLCGSYTDLVIFRESLKKELHKKECVVANRGYPDERCRTPGALSEDDRLIAARPRARHETINGRIKRFCVLRSPFRNAICLHSYCFHAVAHIIQVAKEYELLYHVHV